MANSNNEVISRYEKDLKDFWSKVLEIIEFSMISLDGKGEDQQEKDENKDLIQSQIRSKILRIGNDSIRSFIPYLNKNYIVRKIEHHYTDEVRMRDRSR